MAPEAEPKVMFRNPWAVAGPVMVPASKPAVAVPKLMLSAVVMVVLAIVPPLLPVLSVFQKALLPQVPPAVPNPRMPEPSGSQ